MSRSPFAYCLLGSAGLWALLFILFPPGSQNFPIWDDFAFSQSAFLFARGEGIHYLHWASMPQLGQWLWAAPFIWLFGPSQAGLRLSTILLSWFGLWGLYDLLCQDGFRPRKAAFVVAALAFNPFFFLLQGTFMSDVSSLSFCLLALALYGRAVRSGKFSLLLGASAIAVLAATTRQNMIAVPIVAAALLWRSSELRRRPAWWIAASVPLVIAGATHWWFVHRADVWVISPLRPFAPFAALMPYLIFHSLGLGALPALALAIRPRSWRPFLYAVGLMIVAALYWWLHRSNLLTGGIFPYWADLISQWGVETVFVVGEPPLLLGTGLRITLTLAGCLGGALLIARLAAATRQQITNPLMLFAALQIPLLLAVPTFFDRYLLTLLPAALYLAALPAAERPRNWLPGLAMVGGVAIVSVGLAHDWLAVTTARWRLATRAVTRLDVWDLEASLNWDGWHTPSPRPNGKPAAISYQFEQLKKFFPQIRAAYIIGYSAYESAVVTDREPYTSWLPPVHGELLLLRQPIVPDTASEPPGSGVRGSPRIRVDSVPRPLLGEEWLWTMPFHGVNVRDRVLAVMAIVLLVIAAAASSQLWRQTSFSRGRSIWLLMALVGNPMLLGLPSTLPIDVAALSCSLIALALYVRAPSATPAIWVAACIIATAGAMMNPAAVAAPVAAGWLFFRGGWRLRDRLAWLAAILLPLLVAAVDRMVSATGQGYSAFLPTSISPTQLLLLPYWAVRFCGWAALPALVVAPPRPSKRLAIALAIMAIAAFYWWDFPPEKVAAGPDLFLHAVAPSLSAAGIPRWATTLAGCVAGAALLARCGEQRRRIAAMAPLTVFGVVQASFLLISPFWFYRVFLFVVPTAVFLGGQPESTPDRLPKTLEPELVANEV